jgi:hypothetical protein
MDSGQYITDADKQQYRNFCLHHLPAYGRPRVDEVWHYTNADGLIGIMKSGQIWSTQVACLNDSLEQRYFGDLVHRAVKLLIPGNTDANLAVMLRIADDALAKRDFATAWHFVACFSDVEDDLGQWRGYGGGECGYAIGFNFDGIVEALKSRPSVMLLPMQYDEKVQNFVVDDVVRMAREYFRAGLSRGFSDVQKWAREFLAAFAWELDIFASITKHPKFSSECERRIATALQPGEHKQLEFRQKHTLLARHLPIDLTVGEEKKLPISRIYIGPGPAQRVSQVSVGDLLLKFGYEGTRIELSAVPYRIP